jgi:hypothetical protein
MAEELVRELSRMLQGAEDAQRQATGMGITFDIRHGDTFGLGGLDAQEKFRTFKSFHLMEKEAILEAILRNDLGKLRESMDTQAKDFAEQTEALMRETYDKAVETTGNKVTFPKEGSLSDAYLEALRTAEFTVVGEGQVIPPVIYVDDPAQQAEYDQRLKEEMRKPEFRVRLEEVRREGVAKAIRKERERLSRYEGAGETDDG